MTDFKPIAGFAMPPADVLAQIEAHNRAHSPVDLSAADDEAERTCIHGKTPGCDECAVAEDDEP